MEDYLKVVVVGEVDAGKSTLIGRFLFEMGSLSKEIIDKINYSCAGLNQGFEFAYLLDSFEEERNNKLTIDTTQVFCKDKKGKGFVFIDVPGHRQLLKNALCGSAYADIAILVVDIGKSIEAGSRTHVNILKFLGIERIIVVLNKMDSASFNEDVFKRVKSEVVDFFKASGLTCEYIIPAAASQGEGLIKRSKKMSWYRGLTLIMALNRLKKTLRKGKKQDFYFAIQDNYFMDGENFLLGPILSGSINKGQVIKIAPSGRESRIKKINLFGQIKPHAVQNESPGLALKDVAEVNRGQVLYTKTPPQVTGEIAAKIFCVRQLNIQDTFILKCLSQEIPAKISRISKVIDTSTALESDEKKDTLDAGTVTEVVITTEKPVVIKKYSQLSSLGRFVLEDKNEICAAGIIV